MTRSVLLGAFILMIAGIAAAADSPIDKGSLYLGGSLYFQNQSGDLWEEDGDALTSFGVGDANLGLSFELEVSPTIGYFIAPSVFLGGQIAFLQYSLGDNDISVMAFGPTVGYFFNLNSARTEVKGALYPYVRGFFNYGQLSFGEDDDVNVYQYGGKGGLLYMLSSAVAADASVRFQGDSWKPDGADESTTGTIISLGVGITAFIY